MLLIRKKIDKIIKTIYDRALHYSNSLTFLCTFLLDIFFIKNIFFYLMQFQHTYLIFILSQNVYSLLC